MATGVLQTREHVATGEGVVDWIRELIRAGKARRIIVKNAEDEVILDAPAECFDTASEVRTRFHCRTDV